MTTHANPHVAACTDATHSARALFPVCLIRCLPARVRADEQSEVTDPIERIGKGNLKRAGRCPELPEILDGDLCQLHENRLRTHCSKSHSSLLYDGSWKDETAPRRIVLREWFASALVAVLVAGFGVYPGPARLPGAG